ncbi:MAG TPA: amidase family protein [candidate division Zixibacteria bacterium]|nr:amidase family protein [candidate division Zixibacteria bacterium]
MADLFRLSASEAAARIREGTLTSEALVRSCLERIDARESQVRAWAHLDRDFALAQARECDRSASRGPIHGIPFAAKDIMDTADLPTEYGSPIYEGHRPAADAACVALSRAAGGVLLGKTVTTEFASRFPWGKTTNPHDPGHTPGGSSSGSAAAVADCMVPLAFGTQTVGSVIRPAAFCGCIGYKPSYGEISTQGVKQNTASFDTVGLFARAVEDIALFRAAVTGFAPKPLAAPAVSELKIGFCRTMFWDRAEAYTKTLLEEAASTLAKAGAKVSDFELGEPFERFEIMGRRINDYEFSRALAWERNRHWNLLSELQRNKLSAWLDISYEQYREAEAVLARCRARLADAMKDVDLLLTPSALGEAPAGLTSTGDTSFNILATWTYTPCVTLPVFTGPSGLPVGIQLIGHRNQDHRLLEGALAVYRVVSK